MAQYKNYLSKTRTTKMKGTKKIRRVERSKKYSLRFLSPSVIKLECKCEKSTSKRYDTAFVCKKVSYHF